MVKKSRKGAESQDLFFKATPTAIFTLAGLFYLALPHELHVGLGLDFTASHSDHVVFGIVFLLLAGVVWHINGKRAR